jgi:hypothetical protein
VKKYFLSPLFSYCAVVRARQHLVTFAAPSGIKGGASRQNEMAAPPIPCVKVEAGGHRMRVRKQVLQELVEVGQTIFGDRNPAKA